MKISVVTAYYNRRALFLRTLRTIAASRMAASVEVIAVDDASRDEERIEDLGGLTGLDMTVVRIDPREKWWRNSCIPFNRGFNLATGDIVVLQNPECLHLGDVIAAVAENVVPGRYVNFACYSVDEPTTRRLHAVDPASTTWQSSARAALEPIAQRATVDDGESAWYNHSVHKPTKYHFCAALHRSDLESLGGFDERYANGIAFDDNDWLTRVTRMGLDIRTIDDPFVVHQYHGKTNYGANLPYFHRNKALYENVTLKEMGHRVYSRCFPCFDE